MPTPQFAEYLSSQDRVVQIQLFKDISLEFPQLVGFMSKDSEALRQICLRHPDDEAENMIMVFHRMERCFAKWSRLFRKAKLRLHEILCWSKPISLLPIN